MSSHKITESVVKNPLNKAKNGVMSVMITFHLLHLVIQLLSIMMKLKSFT